MTAGQLERIENSLIEDARRYDSEGRTETAVGYHFAASLVRVKRQEKERE